MSLKKEFGKRVKFLREERKLSQAKLGELIGVEALAVSRIENGENFVRAETLEAIKNAFCEITKNFLILKKKILMIQNQKEFCAI